MIARTSEWAALERHASAVRDAHLRDLFASDPARGEELVVDVADLHIDYSKNRVTRETLALLAALARRAGLPRRIEAMFAGGRINVTEGRPALHVALRAPRDAVIEVDGHNVVPDVHAVLDRMAGLAERVRSGAWTGATGERIRAVVNIGIGGSDLGPAMAYRALRDRADPAIEARFVSNIDGVDVLDAVDGLDPRSTLFVVCSKTFTTLETLTNARSAREWLLSGLAGEAVDDPVRHHFVAVSTNAEEVEAFGIDSSEMLGFWDWVGGRYSVDSAIGLSLAIAIGPERFRSSSRASTRWTSTSAPRRSSATPRSCWGSSGSGTATSWARRPTRCCPTASASGASPAYLQQLDMESNGKSVDVHGRPVETTTGPVVWGAGHQRPARLLPAHPSGDPAGALRPDRVPPVDPGAGRAP